MEQSNPSSIPLSETTLAQVRELLEHLYDFAYLQNHPLAQARFGPSRGTVEPLGTQVKKALMEAIESLNPGVGVYFREPQARPYHMLLLHYVERMTIQKAARELGVSERQAYRDLRAGEESVAARLLAEPQPLPGEVKQETIDLSKATPAAANSAQANPSDLAALLRGAVSAVSRLAEQQQVALQVSLPAAPCPVFTDPALARQVLVNLVSRAVQQAAGSLTLELEESGENLLVRLRYPPRRSDALPETDPLIAGFIQQLGWSVQAEPSSPGQRSLALEIPLINRTLLVIDDEEGFSALLRRYLTGLPVRLVSAASGEQGLALAGSLAPDLILLDVMMPGLDGWELLQRIRTDPRLLSTPVVICSVFNDPELARSLGATDVLAKPVSQEEFLRALARLGILHGQIE